MWPWLSFCFLKEASGASRTASMAHLSQGEGSAALSIRSVLHRGSSGWNSEQNRSKSWLCNNLTQSPGKTFILCRCRGRTACLTPTVQCSSRELQYWRTVYSWLTVVHFPGCVFLLLKQFVPVWPGDRHFFLPTSLLFWPEDSTYAVFLHQQYKEINSVSSHLGSFGWVQL